MAIIGGSVGVIAGMYTFRHKTRHWYFVIGMPALLILQLAVVGFLGIFPFQQKNDPPQTVESTAESPETSAKPLYTTVVDIPEYAGQDTIELNNNKPSFTQDEIETIQGEHFDSC